MSFQEEPRLGRGTEVLWAVYALQHPQESRSELGAYLVWVELCRALLARRRAREDDHLPATQREASGSYGVSSARGKKSRGAGPTTMGSSWEYRLASRMTWSRVLPSTASR